MKNSQKAGAAGAGAILLAVSFIQPWEGLWTTAKVDTIGTGEPVTVCYGATKAEIPNLKVGQKFTKKECTDLLLKSLPKYWNEIASCIHVELPDSPKAALISSSYNAGGGAVCKSPMVAKMNAGHIRGGCKAFYTEDAEGHPTGWYIRAKGRVVPGLVNRRKSEQKLCLNGANEPTAKPSSPEQKIGFWTKLKLFFLSLFKRT
jgi:lysozyme